MKTDDQHLSKNIVALIETCKLFTQRNADSHLPPQSRPDGIAGTNHPAKFITRMLTPLTDTSWMHHQQTCFLPSSAYLQVDPMIDATGLNMLLALADCSLLLATPSGSQICTQRQGLPSSDDLDHRPTPSTAPSLAV